MYAGEPFYFTKVVSKLLLEMTEIGCFQHKVQNDKENYIWHKKVNTELFLFPINVKVGAKGM